MHVLVKIWLNSDKKLMILMQKTNLIVRLVAYLNDRYV